MPPAPGQGGPAWDADDVSLLGTGPMGAPIAAHLIDQLGAVTVWNRTASRAAALQRQGARLAANPAAAARPLVLTVLPDLPQVREVLDGPQGLLAGWRARGVQSPTLVVHGTVSPVAVRAFAEELAAEHGITVLDAPLSGGTAGAERGALVVMVGGAQQAVDRVTPVFRCFARSVQHLGASGAGAAAKLCNQVVVAATVTAISEALVLAEGQGLDVRQVLDVLGWGLADSEVLRQKTSRWANGDYAGGGSAVNQLKDLRFVREAAAAVGAATPLTEVVEELFAEVVDQGQGALDHTVVHQALQRRAGL